MVHQPKMNVEYSHDISQANRLLNNASQPIFSPSNEQLIYLLKKLKEYQPNEKKILFNETSNPCEEMERKLRSLIFFVLFLEIWIFFSSRFSRNWNQKRIITIRRSWRWSRCTKSTRNDRSWSKIDFSSMNKCIDWNSGDIR